jgi:hypothetical protein
MKSIIIIALLASSFSYFAQIDEKYYDSISNKKVSQNKFEKKVLGGIHYTLGWSSIQNLDNFEVFTKPSVGIGININYYPVKWIGLNLGVSHQMRGTGIISPDVYKALGDADSTHLCRWRTNSLNIPIQIIVRSPFSLFKNSTKVTLMAGVTPSIITSANRFFLSTGDGFHLVTSMKNDFISGFDFLYHLGMSVDMNIANSTIFRIKPFYEMGLKQIYTNPITNTLSGKNRLFGVEFHFLF